MYKLVSNIEGSRWSYLNGCYIFGNVVWLKKENINKYTLIDAKGKKIPDIKNEDLLVEVEN